MKPLATEGRILALACAAILLSACASTPPPNDVAVDTNMRNPAAPSINARVLTDTTVMNYSFIGSLDPDAPDEPMTRLESSYTVAMPGDEQKVRVGDTVSTTSSLWGSSVRYGGMQFGTRIDPSKEVLRGERLATHGVAVLPTAADALFAGITSKPTLYNEQNIAFTGAPTLNESNALEFVAQDALGQSESFTAPLATNVQLVDEGCKDFSVGLGKVRRDYAVLSNEYGPMFANTTVVCGAPLGFTVEGHGEYLADEVTAFGVGVARQLGVLGTASVAVAQSETEIGQGWLARMGFEHQGSLVNFIVRSRMQSREFREVGTAWTEDPIMKRNLASLGLSVSDSANIALAYAAQTTWSRERADMISLTQKMQVGAGSISMSAGHSFEQDLGSSLFLSYKRPFGGRAPIRFDKDDLELLEVQLPN